jgi:hypothetical protein
MGQWSSGYDVALTTRRSPVQFRPGPFFLKIEKKFLDGQLMELDTKCCQGV